MEIIHDLLWLWILGALSGTGYILWALFVRPPAAPPARPAQQITTRRTPSAAPPVARPAQPGTAAPMRAPSASGTPSGSPEHQRRGSAPTVKLQAETGSAASADDAAAADLFSGLSEARAKADAAVVAPLPPPPPKIAPKDDVEKAGRIEQYGFHVGSKAAAEPPPPPPAKPAEARPATAVEGAPRTQTQELDDILKRIDAVLSESGSPASEATMPNQQQATMPLPQSPPTEKLERRSTDPNQQKLF